MLQHLSVIEHDDAVAALDAALSVRAAGGVPLIVDPRAPVVLDPQLHVPEAAAWATLTSGTTGAPKIVVRTAESWSVAFPHLNAELSLRSGDGLWMPVHPVSSMALFSAAWAHHTGAELVVPTSSEPGLDRASIAHVTPVWLERLLELVETGAPSTVHTVLVGGDRLTSGLQERARAAGLRVITYVGAAELSFVAWDIGDGLEPFPQVATRDHDGELWVAGPHIALEVIGGQLRTEVVDGTRWATVGDRVVARDGTLTFLGRSDGAIMTAGATVLPNDVEAVLNQHPKVDASLVLGRPDAVLGQRLVAWVEGTADTAELRTWVRHRLPKAAQPVQWHHVAHLPRTVSGKIRRGIPEEA